MRNNSTWAPSALSPTNWPRESWHWGLTLLAFFGLLAIYVVVQVLFVVIAFFFGHMTAQQLTSMPPTLLLVLQFATFTPIAIFLLAVLPPLSKTSLADLGFRKPTGRELAIGAIGAIVMAIVVDGSGSLIASLTHRHDTEQAVMLLKSLKTVPQKAMFVFLACIFAPVCEELAFRSFVFNALTKWLPISGAAIVSGAFFGIMHVSAYPGELATVGIPLMLGGIVLAYVYATTRCFWSNVTAHALFNSVSVASYFLLHAS